MMSANDAGSIPSESTPNGAGCNYAPLPGSYDEMLAGEVPRPHWQRLVQAVGVIGMAELTRRWQEGRQLIREHGVSYNVHGDPGGLDRPWQLDPVPLVISAGEASALEAGLIQRARLLEKTLADVYGPQHLLARGLIPPELVFGNPGFLRPCHGLKLPGNRYLHFLAVDLGRGPDGSFRVLGDRTQASSGAGYALENRIVLSRILPEVFRDCQVQRLALFFRTFRQKLRDIAPHSRDNPRVVLLTPGPANETYFEHAYLARYLGYTLVEGGDLTVRDNRVYQKLLGGLQPVDVLFRRLEDDGCDPLELRGDSLQGVPGLVQAVQAGNVAVANPLGSGWMESPGLLPYLPGLCRHLLGVDLRIPSVPAWWCGEDTGRAHVLANLERMVIKPAFPGLFHDPIFPARLNAADRTALADTMRARPQNFVGQEQLELSTTPVLVDHHLEPRHMVVRAYLTANEESFAVMPGGLTRVTASADNLVVSMQEGGGSKDTWVLASGPVSTFSLLSSPVQGAELTRGGDDLPSRAADNLFWLGRYVERAEGTVRLLRGILIRLTEKPGLAEVPELPHLVRALGRQAEAFTGFAPGSGEMTFSAPEKELHSFLFESSRKGTLAATLADLDRVAGMVRDRISMDMWRILSSLYSRGEGDQARDEEGVTAEADAASKSLAPRSPLGLSDVLDLLNRTVVTLAAFGGLAADSMTRGHAWRFLDLGRRLERAAHVLSLLRSTLTTPAQPEGPLLEALLEIADSLMTYRRRYLHRLAPAPVIDLLLADETNPRSVAFQFACLAEQVELLPRNAAVAGRTSEQRIILAGLTSLRLADMNQLAETTAPGNRPHLDDLLGKLAADLPALSDAITQSYLSHLQPARHLGNRE